MLQPWFCSRDRSGSDAGRRLLSDVGDARASESSGGGPLMNFLIGADEEREVAEDEVVADALRKIRTDAFRGAVRGETVVLQPIDFLASSLG